MSYIVVRGHEFTDLRRKLAATLLFLHADKDTVLSADKYDLDASDLSAIRHLGEYTKCGTSAFDDVAAPERSLLVYSGSDQPTTGVSEDLMRRTASAIGKLVHRFGDGHDFLKSFGAINNILGKMPVVALGM